MLPFTGYTMGGYVEHWIETGNRLKHPPQVFHVNWFRKGSDGGFLWPGFGENVRVLKWMLDRIEGRAAGIETPIGTMPTPSSLTLDGLSISRDVLDELLSIDAKDWEEEEQAVGKVFTSLGRHLPQALWDEHKALTPRLSQASVGVK
jgi:phosphoenolpyruvate carboxykinase (GTP)